MEKNNNDSNSNSNSNSHFNSKSNTDGNNGKDSNSHSNININHSQDKLRKLSAQIKIEENIRAAAINIKNQYKLQVNFDRAARSVEEIDKRLSFLYIEANKLSPVSSDFDSSSIESSTLNSMMTINSASTNSSMILSPTITITTPSMNLNLNNHETIESEEEREQEQNHKEQEKYSKYSKYSKSPFITDTTNRGNRNNLLDPNSNSNTINNESLHYNHHLQNPYNSNYHDHHHDNYHNNNQINSNSNINSNINTIQIQIPIINIEYFTDFWKCNQPLSISKIRFKINELSWNIFLQEKLLTDMVEKMQKEGISYSHFLEFKNYNDEKLIKNSNNNSNNSNINNNSSSNGNASIEEIKSKIRLLQRSLNNYTSLIIDENDNEINTDNDENEIDTDHYNEIDNENQIESNNNNSNNSNNESKISNQTSREGFGGNYWERNFKMKNEIIRGHERTIQEMTERSGKFQSNQQLWDLWIYINDIIDLYHHDHLVIIASIDGQEKISKKYKTISNSNQSSFSSNLSSSFHYNHSSFNPIPSNSNANSNANSRPPSPSLFFNRSGNVTPVSAAIASFFGSSMPSMPFLKINGIERNNIILELQFYSSKVQQLLGVTYLRFDKIAKEGNGKEKEKIEEGEKEKDSNSSKNNNNQFMGEWEIEPLGRFKGLFQFQPNKPSKTSILERIERKMAFRKRENCIVINGHHMEYTRFFQLVKCALCHDFIYNSAGYRCNKCIYLCHGKCKKKIFVKCILPFKSSTVNIGNEQENTETNMKMKMKRNLNITNANIGNHGNNNENPNMTLINPIKFNIPHRFKPSSMLNGKIPEWCMHCGLLVQFIGKRPFEKCIDCGLSCHYDCLASIPNYCGLTMEMANALFLSPISISSPSFSSSQSIINSQSKVIEIGENSINITNSNSNNRNNNQNGNGNSNRTGNEMQMGRNLFLPMSKYQIIRLLGHGNFGKVYLASMVIEPFSSQSQSPIPSSIPSVIAIKVIKREMIDEYDDWNSIIIERQIFELIVRTKFPFLVQYYNYMEDGGRIYFIMEYAAGGDLMFHIQRRSFTLEQARFYGAEILLALQHLHQHGIIYRDLKLDNILLGEDGHVRLTDYGLCKPNMSWTSRTRTFCGTPEFMAPELVMEEPYGMAVDWWSFGVLIYEMIVGKAPFYGTNDRTIFNSILRGKVEYPVDIDPDAKDLISRLLVREPKLRLGEGKHDAMAIIKHSFFNKIDWKRLLRKEMEPPFIPILRNNDAIEAVFFEKEFTNAPINDDIDRSLTIAIELR